MFKKILYMMSFAAIAIPILAVTKQETIDKALNNATLALVAFDKNANVQGLGHLKNLLTEIEALKDNTLANDKIVVGVVIRELSKNPAQSADFMGKTKNRLRQLVQALASKK